MRILYFTKNYTVHDRRFLRKLSASGNEIYLLVLEQAGTRTPLPCIPDVRLLAWNGVPRAEDTYALQSLVPSFRSIVSQVKPDVVHAGPVPDCGFVVALSGFRPFVAMSWASDILLSSRASEAGQRIRFTLQHCDVLQCDCEAVRRKALEYVPIPAGSVVQFPWGVDVQSFRPPAQPRPAHERLAVLCTRSWEPIYGPLTVLDAFRHAFRRRPQLHLVMLGSGSLEAQMRAFIRREGIDDAVELRVNADEAELPSSFRAADLYLSCSRSDGSSVSLLEAMASGLPVIASDIPGNREWIVPGHNGWLSPPGDVEGFGKSVLLACSLTADERAQIGTVNRRISFERADWDRNFPLLLEAYGHLHERRPAALGRPESAPASCAAESPRRGAGAAKCRNVFS